MPVSKISRYIAISLLAATISGLMGCGAESGGGNVIRVTRNIGGREGFRKHFNTWKTVFERNNPGWSMELIDLGNVEGSEFYKSRIATGDLPEVLMTWELASFLSDSGHLIPLPKTYYEKFGIPIPAPYKGKWYTTQGGLQIQGVVINKKMWNDIGVTEPPPTWDAYFDAFHKLKAKGYKPLVLGGREWSAAQPMFFALSVNMYDLVVDPDKPSWTKRKDLGNASFATEPAARQALEKMIYMAENFVDKGALSDSYNEEQRDFYGGKGATWMMGCWMAGDIEPNKVEFDMEYWPVPSFTGRPPIFIKTSGMQSGWAMSTSASGPKQEKAMAVLETFYDPEVYQEYLNGECQFGEASNVPVNMPRYAWPAAQRLIENMRANLDKYGTTPGFHIALDDMPPPGIYTIMTRVMQEIMSGNHDVDQLLGILDSEWVNARKGT